MKTLHLGSSKQLVRSAPSSTILAVAAVATCVACGSATADEATGSTSEALCPVGVICRHLPPPPPPPPPPPQGTSVTIAAGDFEETIQLALAGGQLSIDTTDTATPIDAPPAVTIPNRAWEQCVASESTCNSERGPVRLECIELIAAQCATMPEIITTDTAYYSYITFGPAGLQYGASNYLFNVSTIHHVGTVSFDVDINRVGTTFGYNVSAGFDPGATANGPPGAWLSVSDITSATPTCILSGDYPDVNLTDMTAYVVLSDITPTADGQSVDYGAEQSSFTFQWGVDDLPNWLVSEFVDVQGTIETDVTQRIDDAFTESSTHEAISTALGALITRDLNAVGVTSFTITQITYVDGNWQVFYQPS